MSLHWLPVWFQIILKIILLLEMSSWFCLYSSDWVAPTHLESCVVARSRFGCWGSYQENQDSVSPLMKKSSPHWLDIGLGWEIDVRLMNWSWSFFIHLSTDPTFKIIKWKTRMGLSGECVCMCACVHVCVGALWICSKLITVEAKKLKSTEKKLKAYINS